MNKLDNVINYKSLPVENQQFTDKLVFLFPMQSASFEDCGIETNGNHCSGCSVQACRVDWYTNHTFIPGPATQSDDMYQHLDCLTGEKTSSTGTANIP